MRRRRTNWDGDPTERAACRTRAGWPWRTARLRRRRAGRAPAPAPRRCVTILYQTPRTVVCAASLGKACLYNGIFGIGANRPEMCPQSPSPRSRSRSKSGQGSRGGSRTSSVGSKQSRGSRSFLGAADFGGPVIDGNIRVLNSIECGGEIFSLRSA